MTDNEIIKALECLTGEPKLCKGCPYNNTEQYPFCREGCAKDALDLIQRQQEQIKALITGQETLQKYFAEEKKRIVEQLEEAAFQEDAPIYKGDVEVDSYLRLSKAIEIMKGIQNE